MIVTIEYPGATPERKNAVLENIRSGMSLDEMLDIYGLVDLWDCLIVLTNREDEIWEAMTFVDDNTLHEMEDCIDQLTEDENCI